MAAAVAGIWSPSLTHNPATAKAAETATGSATSAGDSASISANDFLTLLVTEMQNQDPTANTDPNEYINQLVQVNSLEQLISINQTLTADSSEAASNGAAKMPGARVQPALSKSETSPESTPAVAANHLQGSAVREIQGNLTIPEGNPSAIRVAQALGNR